MIHHEVQTDYTIALYQGQRTSTSARSRWLWRLVCQYLGAIGHDCCSRYWRTDNIPAWCPNELTLLPLLTLILITYHCCMSFAWGFASQFVNHDVVAGHCLICTRTWERTDINNYHVIRLCPSVSDISNNTCDHVDTNSAIVMILEIHFGNKCILNYSWGPTKLY